MTDQNIGIRVGAVSNQAANILSGSWRALADGTLTEAQLIELHGDIAKGLLQNAQDLEASFGLATHLGATAASPQEAAAFQPQQQAPQQGFTPANNVVQAPFGQQEPQAQFGPTTRVTAQPVQQGQNFQPATAAPGTGGSKADNEWMAPRRAPRAAADTTTAARPVSATPTASFRITGPARSRPGGGRGPTAGPARTCR